MESDSLFQFSIENVLEIVLVFNGNGIISYANQAAWQQLEYSEDLTTRLITDVFPNEFIIENGQVVIKASELGIIRDMVAYRKNRTCFPARVKVCSFRGGMRPVYICMVENISTENYLEKQANLAGQEAEEAQKIKTEFVANVTHELRTPVNGILGNTQELISRETEAEKLKLLHLVERGCKDMHALINNILDFSKLEAGKFVLEPRRFHFRNMIDYVKGNHNNKIIEKGLDFSITVSPEIPEYIIGDELRIVQILNNLISNASKFTSVGGVHVEAVKTAQTGNKAELFFMVIDTGIGIAKADQDKLFKSFSQVDASISRKYGGTGLGLNICKQLVELMGGSIHVESDVGKGTIFSFHIWVELVQEEGQEVVSTEFFGNAEEQQLVHKLQALSLQQSSGMIKKFGETENKEEIEKKMSKLILCVEMENWEKAEMFAETIKELVEEAPKEIKSAALRLKMAVQKGDYDKAIVAFETLQNML